jgi:cell wall-associated NlpC family hydrolase
MFFTMSRSGQAARFAEYPANQTPQRTPLVSGKLASACRVLALSWVMIGLVPAAHAQNMAGVASPQAAAASAANSAAASSNGATALNGGANSNAGNSAEANDPVTRFLSEKGLLPSSRPVVELAQQVRDKATDLASDLVLSAMNFLGVPYRRGGTSSESGFDCSGFTRHVFESSLGLILPRRASEQANSPELIPVKKSELKPGDLVFFNTLRHTFSHVGIYIGDDKFIHSPRAGGQVRVEDMRQSYWQQRFDGARRAPSIAARQAAASPNN